MVRKRAPRRRPTHVLPRLRPTLPAAIVESSITQSHVQSLRHCVTHATARITGQAHTGDSHDIINVRFVVVVLLPIHAQEPWTTRKAAHFPWCGLHTALFRRLTQPHAAVESHQEIETDHTPQYSANPSPKICVAITHADASGHLEVIPDTRR